MTGMVLLAAVVAVVLCSVVVRQLATEDDPWLTEAISSGRVYRVPLEPELAWMAARADRVSWDDFAARTRPWGDPDWAAHRLDDIRAAVAFLTGPRTASVCSDAYTEELAAVAT